MQQTPWAQRSRDTSYGLIFSILSMAWIFLPMPWAIAESIDPSVLLPPTPTPAPPAPLQQPFRKPPLPPVPPDPPALERYLSQPPPALPPPPSPPSAHIEPTAQPLSPAISAQDPNATPNQHPTAPTQPSLPPPTANPVYGELAEVGLRRLLNPYSYWSVGVGPNYMAGQLFLLTTPQVGLVHESWQVQLQVPLNLQMAVFAERNIKLGSFRIRQEDWLHWSDFFKVVRLATFGHHEDPIYVAIGSILPLTLGHGMLLNRYQSNVGLSTTYTGLQFHLNQPFGGLQLALNDVTFQQTLVGALLYLRPLFALAHPMVRSLSLGVEYVADTQAPTCILRSESERICLQGSQQQADTDRENITLQRSFAHSNRKTGYLVYNRRLIHALGVSLEGQIFRHEQWGNSKLYATWHRFLQSGGGQGLAFGLLTRLYLGQTWQQALRIRTEMRVFGTGFRPSYFDTTYNLNKLAYSQDQHPYQVIPTKSQVIFGDQANGFAQRNTGQRLGFRLDGQWALFVGGRAHKRIALAAGIEGSNGRHDATAYVHAELPLFRALQIMGTLMRANAPTLGDLLQFSPTNGGQFFAILATRIKCAPFAWINAYYQQTYGPSKLPGLEYQLGVPQRIVDGDGRPSRFQFLDQILMPVTTITLELELGWDL